MVKSNLVIGLINICSLGTGHEELIVAMEHHNVDVLGINETWLKEGEEGRAPKISGYRLVHKPRPPHVRARGGGVGFYVRNSLNVKVLKHPCCFNVEQMWITFNIRCKKLVIGTAYRPPWLNIDTFVNAVYESVVSFSWADNMIVMGDFNINFKDTSTMGYRKLTEFLTMTSLSQIVNEPTHFTNHSETILDLVCTDISVRRIAVNHINDLSHHALVTCELHIAKDKPIPLKIEHRSIKDIDMDLFDTAMTNINWDIGVNLREWQGVRGRRGARIRRLSGARVMARAARNSGSRSRLRPLDTCQQPVYISAVYLLSFIQPIYSIVGFSQKLESCAFIDESSTAKHFECTIYGQRGAVFDGRLSLEPPRRATRDPSPRERTESRLGLRAPATGHIKRIARADTQLFASIALTQTISR
ncbi:unnamed protein product [Colias eurytheme]|nr:unnamed protein product [Colias eurytheme]